MALAITLLGDRRITRKSEFSIGVTRKSDVGGVETFDVTTVTSSG